MRKLLGFFLILSLIFGLSACTQPADPGETTSIADSWLQAGFARVDITPDYTVGLAGSGNSSTRRSKGILDYISMSCIALNDGEKTILVYTVDTLGVNMNMANKMRAEVTTATGIPGDHIFFGATHTHSAPDPLVKDTAGQKYLNLLCTSAANAGFLAVQDLAPARLQATTTEIKGMNFVRHYEMSDGSYAGPNFGTFEGLEIVDYAGEADPQMVLIKLDREDSKRDILMMNWQAHPNRSSELGYYLISADFVGAARSKLEEETGMHVAYFTGASGNVHIDSMIESDQHGMKWKYYGEALADFTLGAIPSLKDIGGTGINTTQNLYNAPIDHSWDHMLAAADEVYNVWQTEGKAQGDALGLTYDFTSVYQARSIRERAKLGETIKWEMNAFRVGNIGFTVGVYEMFSEAGAYVKANSPYDVTFVITGNLIYVPTSEAYGYRCYEADTGYFEKGTSEALAQEYIRMLESIQPTS